METDALDLSLLRTFTPMDGLKQSNLIALARKSARKELERGRMLFREGDADKRTYYLLGGQVELLSGTQVVAVVRAGTVEARNPLAPGTVRRFTARAATDIDYISIDADLLDVLLTWDQTGQYEVEELHTNSASPGRGEDWMTTLLQAKALHRIPPSNLQAIFMRMERIQVRAGDVVLKQGDEGDYFYAITTGRCVVTRETPLSRDGIRLAELGPGDTFGEEALISDSKRNATVTMVTDGALMRLNKHDFTTLLNAPMLQWVTFEEAEEAVRNSGARWLDVRLPSEFETMRLPGAINMPLYFIRMKLRQLDPDTMYVCVCDTGRRSSAGAFILNERGYHAVVLSGGLAAAEPARAR